MPTSDRRAPEPPDAVTPAATDEGQPEGWRGVRAIDIQPGTGSVSELVEAVRRALAPDRDGSVPAIAVRPAGNPDDTSAATRAARAAVTAQWVPGGTALIVSTSASTGDPRGVLLGGQALTAAARASAARLQPFTGDRDPDWWLAMPVTNIAGLMVVVRHVVGADRGRGELPDAARPITTSSGVLRPWHGLGGAARFAPATVVDEIARARQAATDVGHALVTSLAPTQVRRLLTDAAGRQALASFEVILVGGAALDDSVRREAAEAGIRLVSTYGMTETCGGVVYDGIPLAGVQVRILDGEADAPATGRVAIGGPILADGYLEARTTSSQPSGEAGAASEAVPMPATEPATEFADGWVLTCDVGRIEPDADGGERLVVIGRADQRVKVRGTLVDLLAVQHAAERVPGVSAACAVGVPEPDAGTEVVLFVEVPGQSTSPAVAGGADEETLAARIQQQILDALGPASRPGRVIVGALDWLPSGKPDRLRLQRRARNDARQEVE